MEISKPSQIFLIVEMVVLLFLPLTTLFKVDWVIPQSVDSLFNEMPFSAHNSRIRDRQKRKSICRNGMQKMPRKKN